MSTLPVHETHLEGVPLVARGKVRDIYDLGDHLLIVATDRLSAFDVVLPDPIPDKGKVLTQISLFWFQQMADITPNHLVAWEVADFPRELQKFGEVLQGRSMLVKKAQPLAIEAIVRGYLSGTGWKDYQATGKVCGYDLPQGLRESDKLPEPLFTPSTKAEIGEHDLNIDLAQAEKIVGVELAQEVAKRALAIYGRARDFAATKGIIIADTKFEFGTIDGELILIDEVLTPDSSRFWPEDKYEPGRGQESYDKQFVRDYLESIGFNKKPPAPKLPAEVIEGTRQRYLEALTRLTGHGLA
ncbi:MAG: phosphoribosylaminoimidazolesuccinocarboxamide synthase [Proteobacteria bacterium]|nr:phosphoribosylaminoimidazolesuccinocarboxamide synthase [Pseudomonadota bacterium]MBU4383955.1 phosphoribosylaminoimidazolesuccinocarboxamide synthase [Pseudomonadota bacterium]MBU4604677.1 phosphoribosylaminoimidazolesuccinocarboxamide synthase [Pseudomonadota bacterium]MCG2763596.1 phosphoribosylaminoimidazolesuccinocarboxamide synthase [Desulfarculaceae bacterium]